MFGMNRKFAFVVVLAAALVMLFIMSSAAFADSTTAVTTVCVDGYVINHRELAVDGTKTLPDLYVEAVGANGTYSATVGSDGYFEFEALPVGSWNFKLKLPEGWEGIVPTATIAGTAETGATNLTEQTACYRIVFKIRRVFGVIVIKWEELLNGTVQPGEGWDITATPVGDPFVKPQTATTDAAGGAVFTLSAGRWVIRETLQNGWTPITPSQVTIDLDQYAVPGAMYPVIFKNLEPPCRGEIDVQKFGFGVDAAGKEIQLGPLAGWKVTLSRADNPWWHNVQFTDGSGKATFSNLLPGVYSVAETVQVGWEAMSDNPQTVVHRDCEVTTVRFDNKEVKGELKISGRKLFWAWTPPYQGTVVGLPGWVITATLVGSDPLIQTTTTTDALGNYVFSEAQLEQAGMAFPNASIQVCEESRDNWIPMSLSCVTVQFPYPVPADYTGATVNFKNRQDPPTGAAPAVVSPTSGCRATVVVSWGQNLARIAAQYGTSVSAIVGANNIKNADKVYAGQRLCIP
ncbi:MAG: LysM peptidoglycan-binding domain-containing protein [Chloroflexi bacterium]|nr:LysM peptidoglycan-binding domain-containing protein [Chloroflexota bacterium]